MKGSGTVRMTGTVDITALCEKLNFEHDEIGMSWNALSRSYDVSVGLLYNIAKHGYNPGTKRVRDKLGLSTMVGIVTLNGNVPDNTLVLGAQRCIKCGRPFISNHPRRRKCYICSPYRGRKS